MTNGYYVAWGVWDAEHRALTARVDTIERHAEAAQALAVASEQARKDREWKTTLALITGVVFPVLVTALLTWLHLRAH